MKRRTGYGSTPRVLLTVTSFLFFLYNPSSVAQGMAGETSSAIHGASGNPGTSTGAGVVQPNEVGRTVNRPEDNAPHALDEVTPPGAEEDRVGTGEFQDQIKQERPHAKKNSGNSEQK